MIEIMVNEERAPGLRKVLDPLAESPPEVRTEPGLEETVFLVYDVPASDTTFISLAMTNGAAACSKV